MTLSKDLPPQSGDEEPVNSNNPGGPQWGELFGRKRQERQVTQTPWQRFSAKWGKGCGSSVCPKAANVCLARGAVPCDILFVGEAPGGSEDSLGLPLTGPAGHLLNGITRQAGLWDPWYDQGRAVGSSLTMCFANLLGCIPIGPDGRKVKEPDVDDVERCSPRLVELVELCRPRLVVCLGRMAREFLDEKLLGSVWESIQPHPEPSPVAGVRRLLRTKHPGCRIPRINLVHPSAILQAVEAQQAPMMRECVHRLASAVMKLQEEEK